MKRFPFILPLCASVLVLICATDAAADAIVVTRAMRASTIAEIFVEAKSIRVELEIGVSDLDRFPNLLPDELYLKLGHEPEEFAQRLQRFLEDDFRILADEERPLAGRVISMELGTRVERDEITGEPLPSGGDAETVVFVVLSYAMPREPRTLTFQAPLDPNTGRVAASVGFVTYHMGIPVNDFRYLGMSETLDLEWNDPWYSRFRNRNLRRRFDAPMSVFLYIENFEVRKEIIVRPKDLQHWVDLGLSGRDTIYAGEQEALRQQAAVFFQDRNPVTIDGRPARGTLDRVHFVRRTLRRTGVVDPPEDLALVSATLGIIFVYPIDSLPNEVTMSWEFFNERIKRVPASAIDEAGGLPYTLQPDDSVLVWQNFLTNPTRPTLAAIDPPGGGSVPLLSTVAGLLLIGVIAGTASRGRLGARSTRVVVVSLAIVTVAAWPVVRVSAPRLGGLSQEQTESVVGGLLTNVYRAFDYRDESAIYDALARSASGDLLRQIYLETRKSLELQNQGGARVKVNEVTLDSVTTERMGGGKAFEARCTWTVSGSVGHWGHLHTRTNQYEALLTIEAVDGAWKITALELLEEKRVSSKANNDLDFKS